MSRHNGLSLAIAAHGPPVRAPDRKELTRELRSFAGTLPCRTAVCQTIDSAGCVRSSKSSRARSSCTAGEAANYGEVIVGVVKVLQDGSYIGATVTETHKVPRSKLKTLMALDLPMVYGNNLPFSVGRSSPNTSSTRVPSITDWAVL